MDFRVVTSTMRNFKSHILLHHNTHFSLSLDQSLQPQMCFSFDLMMLAYAICIGVPLYLDYQHLKIKFLIVILIQISIFW
jgi:hypothetical protein